MRSSGGRYNALSVARVLHIEHITVISDVVRLAENVRPIT